MTRPPQSNVLNIYMAHRDWNWATKEDPAGGRLSLPVVRVAALSAALCCADELDAQGHADAVRAVLTEMVAAQCDVLLAPNVGRSRHLLTEGGTSLLQPARPPHAADASLSIERAEKKKPRAAVQSGAPRAHHAGMHSPVCRGGGDEDSWAAWQRGGALAAIQPAAHGSVGDRAQREALPHAAHDALLWSSGELDAPFHHGAILCVACA